MEKVMYVLWRPPAETRQAFVGRLRHELAPRLLAGDLGLSGLQLNVLDDDVAAGADLVPQGLRRASHHPQMEAVVSVWLPSATPLRRNPVDAEILAAGARTCAYLVSESVLLLDPAPPPTGARSDGFAQVAFLQRPRHQSRAHWLSRWRDHHTAVAIETQQTSEYRQNLVVDRLQAAGPRFAGIVEETFPMEALTDRHVFYDAVGDLERFAANRGRMAASTRTFIDHEHGLDVLPTSQYVFRRPAAG